MRRHIFLSISLFAILFSFNGCGASGDAKKTADAFFIALIDNRINDAINSLDINTAAMEGIENQLKILSENGNSPMSL